MRSISRLLLLPILLLVVTSTSSFAGGNDTDLYRDFFLEFAKHVNPKSMEKSWKKRNSAWTAEMKKAKDVASIGSLAAEFEENVKEEGVSEAWKTRREAWRTDVKAAETPANLGDYMLELSRGMSQESMLEGWGEQFDGWLDTMTDMAVIAEKEEQRIIFDEEAMRPVFDQLWGATANSFKDVKTGEGKEIPNLGTVFHANIKMSQAKSSRIVQVLEDDSDNWRFMAIYDAGQYIDNAEMLLADIAKVIDSMMPEGFPRKTNFLQGYVKTEVYAWELNSPDFNAVAKKASVTLGLRESNGNYGIELIISEPVFK